MIDPTRDVLRSFRMHVVIVEIARVQLQQGTQLVIEQH